MTTVPEDELPLLLPETDEIKPSGTVNLHLQI